MDKFHRQALAFQGKSNDYLDDHTSSIARKFKQEVQKFEDEVQVNKNPLSIENRLKGIIRILEELPSEKVMSHGHMVELVRACETFQEELRKMR